MLSKEVSCTILKVFGMTRPGIEPRYPGPLVNTLRTRPICRYLFVSLADIFMGHFGGLQFVLSLPVIQKVLHNATDYFKMMNRGESEQGDKNE